MIRENPTPSEPWRLHDMLLLYVLTAVGFGLLATAWWGVSGTTKLTHELAWVDLSVVSIMILGTANCLWLLTGRRSVGERRRRLLDAFGSGDDYHGFARTLPGDESSQSVRDEAVSIVPVSAEGMSHYHDPKCQLVGGKATTPGSRSAHERAGRRPCGMCRP